MLRRSGHAVDGPGPREAEPGPGEADRDRGRADGGGAESVRRSAVHAVLRTPGRPLDDTTRADMEARLGADFSDVRVHDDGAARASAAEVGARAYTSGNHVVLGDGGGDRHTLAHELTHVVQQRSGPVAGAVDASGLKVSDPSDRFEREAEATAARVMRAAPTAAGAPRRAADRGAARTVPGSAPDVQRAPALEDLAGEATAGAFGQPAEGAEPASVGTVAIVPAKLGPTLDLVAVAEKYATGFTGGTVLADRFALVIGVNVRVWNQRDTQAAQALLNQKVTDFRQAWGDDRFRVAVIGFTWADDAAEARETNQRTIPYGQIRTRILRAPQTNDMIAGLREAGNEHVYLHTSDSDTDSFATEAGPLFTAATEHLGALEEKPDVFSGGYTSPANRRTAPDDILVWHASRVDLAVRDAMARVNPASVYYPEPSTFVKVQDWEDNLEQGVGFGRGNQEGQQLVESLTARRGGVTAAFDSRFAISTDMGRVGENVGSHPAGSRVTKDTVKQLFTLTQTHARPQEWRDRVSAANGLTSTSAAAMEALTQEVFGHLTPEDLSKLPDPLPGTPLGAKGIDRLAKQEPVRSAGLGPEVIEIAKASRDALIRAVARAVRELG
nr:DUF4157 domain-containing protein [Streptomyces sp. SHP 1-2]